MAARRREVRWHFSASGIYIDGLDPYLPAQRHGAKSLTDIECASCCFGAVDAFHPIVLKFGALDYSKQPASVAAAQQLIQPNRPQLAFHQRCVLRCVLYGIVGRRVNSGVRPLNLSIEVKHENIHKLVW